MLNKTFLLNNGVEIPAIGYGTYKAGDGGNVVIAEAIKQGYRHFDTAAFYFNEEQLGSALKESGIPREEFFITSKLWRDELGYDNAIKGFETSIAKIGTEYLDLYLIHWPRPMDMSKEWMDADVETWKALADLRKDGRVRAIGVSNFLPHHLNNIIERTGIVPQVDQLEFHPGYSQTAAVEYAQKLGITVEAWSPMGRARMLTHPLLVEIAQKYGRSTAQICIRYALQCKVLPLPKSSSAERMRENMNVFDFEIDENDMYRLKTLPPLGWSGEHPDVAWD